MPRMGKTEEDWNGLKLGFLKTVQPNSFSKLIPAACNFKNNAQETYLFVSDLWFCHLHVISLLTLSSVARWGRVIGKIKQNELDCRDTAPLHVPILLAARNWPGRKDCKELMLCNLGGALISVYFWRRPKNKYRMTFGG